MGVCDAGSSGWVDSLCSFHVAGFKALESISATQCNPLSRNRSGINIGEGGVVSDEHRAAAVALRGWGVVRQVITCRRRIRPVWRATGDGRALARAGISAAQIDYVNLHGTGTLQNDAMESRVIHALFGAGVAVSSTKPFTGHALGAAGAIEAGLCWLGCRMTIPRQAAAAPVGWHARS
jgi:3-oxoacyl-[acyl-carrier-protein] synthase-1